MYDDLVARLNAYSAEHQMHGGIAAEAADAIIELKKKVVEWQEDACEWNNKYYHLLDNMPRWISVEEPPKNDRNIFICHGSADFIAPCIGHYDPDTKLFYEDRNWFATIIYDAMFWCEMPKLPVSE